MTSTSTKPEESEPEGVSVGPQLQWVSAINGFWSLSELEEEEDEDEEVEDEEDEEEDEEDFSGAASNSLAHLCKDHSLRMGSIKKINVIHMLSPIQCLYKHISVCISIIQYPPARRTCTDFYCRAH